MSGKLPVFPIPEPQHFNDYGFDPQIDYFQVLEEARRHKRESSRSIDALHFKLQKPISKDDSRRSKNGKKKRWWRNALLFLRRKWAEYNDGDGDRGIASTRGVFRGSISGPVYVTESRSGHCRTTSQPSSGPLAGSLTPARRGEVEIPYISLRDFNVETQHGISAPAMPIYLVT